MADPAVFHLNFDIFRLQLAGIVSHSDRSAPASLAA
jgi:hypothetical protein